MKGEDMDARLVRQVAVLAALCVCGLAVPARADTLSYRHGLPADLEKVVPNLGSGFDALKPTSARPAALTAVPDLSKETQYVALPLGEGPQVFWAAFDPKARGGTLYFDTDGDGDLAEEKPAEKRLTGGREDFGPIAVNLTREGRTGPYHFCMRRYRLSGGDRWYFEPACYNVGNVTIGDKAYRMAVTDAYGNGLFNDFWSPKATWTDHSYVDWNGDGKFGTGESLYCTRRYLRDGQWYAVSFSADGLDVSFTPAEFPMGTVTFGDFEMAAQFTSATGQGGFIAEGVGRIEVPADDYGILRCWVKRVADDGFKWEAAGVAQPGARFQVGPGQESALTVGPPFKASLVAQSKAPRRAGMTISFEAKLTGADGKDYRFRRGTTELPPPKMVILNESGKQLGSYAFQYG
jgi:hypothetical protein